MFAFHPPRKASTAGSVTSRATFGDILRDSASQEWFVKKGCDDAMRSRLFDNIERDGTGVLEASEFVTGVIRLLWERFGRI